MVFSITYPNHRRQYCLKKLTQSHKEEAQLLIFRPSFLSHCLDSLGFDTMALE